MMKRMKGCHLSPFLPLRGNGEQSMTEMSQRMMSFIRDYLIRQYASSHHWRSRYSINIEMSPRWGPMFAAPNASYRKTPGMDQGTRTRLTWEGDRHRSFGPCVAPSLYPKASSRHGMYWSNENRKEVWIVTSMTVSLCSADVFLSSPVPEYHASDATAWNTWEPGTLSLYQTSLIS